MLGEIERAIGQRRGLRQRHFDLVRHQRNRKPRLQKIELVIGVVRNAKRAHLAGLHKRFERAGGFIRIEQRIRAVQQQQLNAIRAEILQ